METPKKNAALDEDTNIVEVEQTPKKTSKFREFLKTKKGKIVLVITPIFILLIAAGLIGLLIVKNKPVEPQVVISENVASDKVYDNYDFIYNSSDNKIVASTADRVKQLDLVSGDQKIMNYIISPDKKKIAYSIGDKDYKNKIFSTNADITKFKFNEVAFKVFLLDLETGKNTQIFSADSYNLGNTKDQLYKKKQIVYPDSYVIYGYYGDQALSYPISYVEYVDDIASGYQNDYLPYDLSVQLNNVAIKAISFDSSSTKVMLTSDTNVYVYNSTDGSIKTLSGVLSSNANRCGNTIGRWAGNNVNIYSSSCYEYFNDKSYIFNGDNFSPVNKDTMGITITLNDRFSIIKQFSSSDYGIVATALVKFNFETQTSDKIKDIDSNSSIYSIDVVGSEDTIIVTSKPSNPENYNADHIYTIWKYIESDNSLSEITSFSLPRDIYNFIYNPANNTFAYYRKYSASSQSIIEYRILDINTKEEKELLSIKVDNDSVLNYNPKLIWLDKSK